MTIKAFIFDLDGVLTDTAEYHYQAWKRLAREESLPFSRQDNEKLRGVSRKASLELILKGRLLPEEDKEALLRRKNRYYKTYIRQISKNDLLPGALELLNILLHIGYQLALASASKNARTVVSNMGLESYFKVIADGNSVKNTKPEPDLFLFAAAQLKVKPEECIVVEDAEAGIEAAKRAGMKTIGIGPPSRVGEADFVYPAVDAIRLEEVLERPGN